MPKRGEIWLAKLGPQRGTEPGKIRPVLVVQAQALLDAAHPSTIIIPLTTSLIDDAEPLRVRLKAADRLRQTFDLLIDQIRAIDNRRLIEGPLTTLDEATMLRVADAIMQTLDITK